MKIIFAIIDHILNLIVAVIFDIFSILLLVLLILFVTFARLFSIHPADGLIDFISPIFIFFYQTIPDLLQPLVSESFWIGLLVGYIGLISFIFFGMLIIPFFLLFKKILSFQRLSFLREGLKVRPFLVKSPTLNQEIIINLVKWKYYRYAVYIVTSVYLYFGSLTPLKELLGI